MTHSQHPLFRERAVKQYLRGQGKDILPHLTISASLCAVLWILLAVLLVALLMVIGGLNQIAGGAV